MSVGKENVIDDTVGTSVPFKIDNPPLQMPSLFYSAKIFSQNFKDNFQVIFLRYATSIDNPLLLISKIDLKGEEGLSIKVQK